MVDGQIVADEEQEEAEPAPPIAGGGDDLPLIQLAGAHLHWQTELAERLLMHAGAPF